MMYHFVFFKTIKTHCKKKLYTYNTKFWINHTEDTGEKNSINIAPTYYF